MKIVCITVGKKHDKSFEPAIAEYIKRLKPHVDFKFEYVQSSNRLAESASIRKLLKPDDVSLLFDEKGDSLNNEQLAGLIETYQNESRKRLVFIIGGAYGVEPQLIKECERVISLSELVLPHQLVRLILVEQLYRSFNILAGGKYHHG